MSAEMNERDRQVAAIAWDMAVAAMRHEDGTPVEIVVSHNPYASPSGGPDRSSAVLVALSEWIDNSPGYADCPPETVLWRRVSKPSLEANEALDALSGMVGENPRKGVYATKDDVIRELLDTATAALGAVEHMTDHRGEALEMLDQHIVSVGRRAGIVR